MSRRARDRKQDRVVTACALGKYATTQSQRALLLGVDTNDPSVDAADFVTLVHTCAPAIAGGAGGEAGARVGAVAVGAEGGPARSHRLAAGLPAGMRPVKASQAPWLNVIAGSSGFLLSRTAMVWGVAATSMQLPPLLLL